MRFHMAYLFVQLSRISSNQFNAYIKNVSYAIVVIWKESLLFLDVRNISWIKTMLM